MKLSQKDLFANACDFLCTDFFEGGKIIPI